MCKKKKKKSHATDHKSQIQTPIDYTRSLTVRAPIGCWSHDHRRGFPRLFVFLGDLRQSSPIGAGESSGDMWWMSEGDVGMDGAHTGGMKRQQQQMRRRRRRRGGGAEGYCAKNTTAGFTTLQSTLCSPHGRFLNVYFLIIYFLTSDQWDLTGCLMDWDVLLDPHAGVVSWCPLKYHINVTSTHVTSDGVFLSFITAQNRMS